MSPSLVSCQQTRSRCPFSVYLPSLPVLTQTQQGKKKKTEKLTVHEGSDRQRGPWLVGEHPTHLKLLNKQRWSWIPGRRNGALLQQSGLMLSVVCCVCMQGRGNANCKLSFTETHSQCVTVKHWAALKEQTEVQNQQPLGLLLLWS